MFYGVSRNFNCYDLFHLALLVSIIKYTWAIRNVSNQIFPELKSGSQRDVKHLHVHCGIPHYIGSGNDLNTINGWKDKNMEHTS